MYIRSLKECNYSTYNRPNSNAPHEFELLVRDCAAIEFRQDFHLYGRSGQAQHGIDIFSDDWTIVIQCKTYKDNEAFRKIMADEYRKAREHFQRDGQPRFQQFIFATALDTDAQAQDIADDLSQAGIPVKIWFWDDLLKTIDNYRIHNDGDTYAEGFEETLFLHRGQPGCENVCLKNLFVPQEYRELNKENGFSTSKDKPPMDDLLGRIQRFCGGQEKMLIIEGDAGSGKSTFAAKLCFEERKHSRQIINPDLDGNIPSPPAPGLLAGRPLLTVRLRDLDDTRNLEQRLGKSILSHLNIQDKKELAKRFPRAVFLLDGFDELCVMLKEQVRDCENMLVQLCGWLPGDCKLILTSRPKYIQVERLHTTFSRISLQHFSPQKRKTWLDQYRALFQGDSSAVDKKVEQYILSIRKNSVSNLCDTPMALYLLIGSKANFELTKNEWALYNYVFSDAIVNTPYADTAHPMGPNMGGLLYRITEEIAYKMYRANGSQGARDGMIPTGDGQFLITDQGVTETIKELLKNPVFQEEAVEAGLTDHETQQRILKRSHALCCYWRSNSGPADGPVEFHHNNIRDFFLCEKIRRTFNDLYQQSGTDEENLKKMTERLVSLFKYGEVNETVCHFLREYARNAVSIQQQNKKEFPLLEKAHSLLPLLYQKLLTDGILYDGLEMKDHVGAIKNILQSTALVYHSVYEPILNAGERIRWWNDVAAVNHSDIINYIFCQLVTKIGYRSDLQKADLHRADLHGADLRGADLSGTDLNRINLHGAKMHEVHLHGANLYRADLSKTVLIRADLKEANLGKAYLNGANLEEADLCNAEFRGVDLRGTTLPDGFCSDNQKKQIGHLKSLNISGLKIQREEGNTNGPHNPLPPRAAGRRAAANLAHGKRPGAGLRRR